MLVYTFMHAQICSGYLVMLKVCTHISAVLFYLEAAYRIKGKETCTQMKCQWVMPSYLSKIEYLPSKDIDFTSPCSKKRKLTDPCFSSTNQEESTSDGAQQVHVYSLPDDSEMDKFFDSLSQCGTNPAILSLLSKYSDKYVTKTTLPQYPRPPGYNHFTIPSTWNWNTMNFSMYVIHWR